MGWDVVNLSQILVETSLSTPLLCRVLSSCTSRVMLRMGEHSVCTMLRQVPWLSRHYLVGLHTAICAGQNQQIQTHTAHLLARSQLCRAPCSMVLSFAAILYYYYMQYDNEQILDDYLGKWLSWDIHKSWVTREQAEVSAMAMHKVLPKSHRHPLYGATSGSMLDVYRQTVQCCNLISNTTQLFSIPKRLF